TELDKLRSAYTDAEIIVDGGVPDVTVRGNDLLNSVFRNLLKNSIQHNDKAVPAVTVSVTEGEETVTVQVADNGPGVPDHQKDEIFGKGEKGLESAGTGIGLYLVQTLVSNYGGEIAVEDNDPEGAVFTVTLPRADETDD
ncbi:MAG: sensor histidine kinase, partial [Halohasta sp.]